MDLTKGESKTGSSSLTLRCQRHDAAEKSSGFVILKHCAGRQESPLQGSLWLHGKSRSRCPRSMGELSIANGLRSNEKIDEKRHEVKVRFY